MTTPTPYCLSLWGEDAHAFHPSQTGLVLGGLCLESERALMGESDADVLLHAITRAIAMFTHEDILAYRARELASSGVLDSKIYLQEALETLPPHAKITHLSLALEGEKPRLQSYIPAIRGSIAKLLDLPIASVGLMVHSGDGLSQVGQGKGLRAGALLSLCVQNEADD